MDVPSDRDAGSQSDASSLHEKLQDQIAVLETRAKFARADHQMELSAKDQEIARLRAEIDGRDQTIAAIFGSTSWKIGAPYRLLSRALPPARRAIGLLIRSPKQVPGRIIVRLGIFVRAHPRLGAVVRRILSFFPAQVRDRLSRAAPPAPDQSGHSLPGASVQKAFAGGDWQWIYNALRK